MIDNELFSLAVLAFILWIIVSDLRGQSQMARKPKQKSTVPVPAPAFARLPERDHK